MARKIQERTGKYLKCRQCGEEYYAKPSRLTSPHGTEYCSKDCRAKADIVMKTCPECGKAKPSRKFQGVTCSLACRDKVRARLPQDQTEAATIRKAMPEWITGFHPR